MRWYSTYKHPDSLNFIIEEDESVGFYVYVYDEYDGFLNDLRDPSGHSSRHQQDHLQVGLDGATHFASRKFGVPEDSWVEIP